MRNKRVRKFLSIFLCVISIVAVFSVTAMATVYYSAFLTFYMPDGDVIELPFSNDGIHYDVGFKDGYYFVNESYEDGTVISKRSYNLDYLYFYDINTGERFYPGDYIILKDDSSKSYALRAVTDDDLIDFSSVDSAFDSIIEILTNFSVMITENALMLFFAIGLPVCSFGVGLLIRLKERT